MRAYVHRTQGKSKCVIQRIVVPLEDDRTLHQPFALQKKNVLRSNETNSKAATILQ